MSNTFTCALCGETFDFEPEKEQAAKAECERWFGDVPDEDLAVVCDHCYARIDPADHPEQVSAAIKELKGDC